MKYMTGNILDFIGRPDAICITTNGFVTSRGRAVMGMGIAKAMAECYPDLPKLLGDAITKNGNVVQHLMTVKGTAIVSFPVKPVSKVCENYMLDVVSHARSKYDVGRTIPGFHCVADPSIIQKSCHELTALLNIQPWDHCIIPIPGCGAGELSYQRDVRQICEHTLDERVWMCSFKKEDFRK